MLDRLGWCWRLVATGLCFASFGLGGLLLWALVFPAVSLLVREPARRACVSRRIIHLTFRFFVGLMRGLGVLTYEMLTGNLPYGTALVAARSRAEQCRLSYRSLLADDRELPAWLDAVIRQAVHPLPQRRHEALSAFIHQLQHPAAATLAQARVPATLARRLQFWQRTAAALVVAVVVLALGLLRLGTG